MSFLELHAGLSLLLNGSSNTYTKYQNDEELDGRISDATLNLFSSNAQNTPDPSKADYSVIQSHDQDSEPMSIWGVLILFFKAVQAIENSKKDLEFFNSSMS